jgi:hypothetical protein
MLVLCLILAHLIADFHLQTDVMVKEKLKYIKKHMFHHLLLTSAALFVFLITESPSANIVKDLIMPVFFIVGTHLIIDFIKIKLIDSIKTATGENLKRLGFFILDQLCHLAIILAACQLFFGQEVLDKAERVLWLIGYEKVSLGPLHSVLFVLIIGILATSFSGHIIRILLGSLPGQLLTFEGKYAFKNERGENGQGDKSIGKNALTEEFNYMVFSKHDLSRGKLIGYIERLLVVLLTFYSAYPAIGFIVAAKSIARFKQLDDRDWAEYFLLGTLTSMFLGIAFGILLREILI